MRSSDAVFQPVGSNTGVIAPVLHDGMPNVRMQRPCASVEIGAPTIATPTTCSSSRRDIVLLMAVLSIFLHGPVEEFVGAPPAVAQHDVAAEEVNLARIDLRLETLPELDQHVEQPKRIGE